MKRLILEQLLTWKNKPHRKPLIVRGARQVGKTYTIDEFGSEHFDHYVKIDFEKQISSRRIFQNDLSPKKLVDMVSVEAEKDIIPGKTLLFLDEIQLCPRALTALRYFYEDLPELHVISAGSLLEFEMAKISFPVGRVEFQYMYPLTFEEFLINSNQTRLNEKRPKLFAPRPLDEFIHTRMMEYLKKYFVVGGMPEAVSRYLETGSLLDVTGIHEALIDSFLQDMLKYEKNIENDLVREIVEVIPGLTGSGIKYSRLSHNASTYKVKQVLHVLEKALLVTPVNSSSAAGLPLGGNINKSVFKLCFLDIGLMQHICGIPAKDVIQSEDLLATYKGALCEQFIGQELKAAGGTQNQQLFYWSRNQKSSSAEVDYLIARDGNIYPIEVKNGPSGSLKSLHLFLREHPHIDRGIVLNSGNIGTVDNIHFMPLYSNLAKMNS